MKRLSRLRRHRAAGPVLLIFALFTIGTTFQVASAVNQENATVQSRSAAIAEGKEIFLRGCSSCHGLNAEGQEIAWVRANQLRNYPMPPADEPLIPALIDIVG